MSMPPHWSQKGSYTAPHITLQLSMLEGYHSAEAAAPEEYLGRRRGRRCSPRRS